MTITSDVGGGPYAAKHYKKQACAKIFMKKTKPPHAVFAVKFLSPGNILFEPSSYMAMMRQCKIAASANPETAANALILSPAG
jgi:hypothetical protein